MPVIFLSLHSINVDVEFSVYMVHDGKSSRDGLTQVLVPSFLLHGSWEDLHFGHNGIWAFHCMRTLDFNNLFGVHVNRELTQTGEPKRSSWKADFGDPFSPGQWWLTKCVVTECWKRWWKTWTPESEKLMYPYTLKLLQVISGRSCSPQNLLMGPLRCPRLFIPSVMISMIP